jgi:hypothetical protein
MDTYKPSCSGLLYKDKIKPSADAEISRKVANELMTQRKSRRLCLKPNLLIHKSLSFALSLSIAYNYVGKPITGNTDAEL